MKRLVSILFIVLSSLSVVAQTEIVLSERDIFGTARYTAMGGAMTAVGADPSAVLLNPAGLGLYRRMEVSLTMQGMGHNDKQLHSNTTNTKKENEASFILPQTSIVFSLQNNGSSALRFCNFMLSYNRLQSFNRTASAHAYNQPSLAGLMVNQVDANGLNEQRVGASRYNSPLSGWLSELGYWNYLIDPVYEIQGNDTNFTGWQAGYGIQPSTYLRSEESGYIDEYAFHWGANISGQWFVGLGLNVRAIHYEKRFTYSEWFSEDYADESGFEQHSSLRQTGAGISGSVGLIYQPLRWLRAGVSFQSPVYQRISTRTDATMETFDANGKSASYDATLIFSERNSLTLPLRSTAGIAFLLRQKGMISLEYDYEHWRNTQDVHTLKIGAEYAPLPNLFLNAGYACQSHFTHTYNQPYYVLSANDVRSDPDFRQFRSAHYGSIGIGYRGKWFIAQLAYQCRFQTYLWHPFAVTSDFASNNIINGYNPVPLPTEQQTISHRIVFTFAWHNH